MAWNQPGKGKQNPWGAPNPGGGMDAMLQRLRELFGGGNPLSWLLPLLALVALELLGLFRFIVEPVLSLFE